ncbi:bromodomain-containing protein 8 [Microplitis demolitor]|uniref:bromodomain-containing protein 8 n=1 Tax=Microplitis demolitor TaxID=69319 RepID=UPI00043FFFFB|nr:bromodomain-containing protein 8 [Microplitis demolitor]
MTSVQERLKTKQRESRDTWSTREQLCLASSVLKSGDQNWISVSRSLKPFAEKEALRPPDWFSHKSCANQYTRLIENVDTPKRKKRESGETIGESIVKRLTQERTAELGQILAFQRDEYQQLKSEVNLLKSGTISDDKLQKMWSAIEQEEREQEQKAKAHSLWLAKRQQKQDVITNQIIASPLKKTLDLSNDTQDSESANDEEEKKSRGPSTLLTNLLKSPSPTKQIQNPTSTAQVTSPTIASLLSSSATVHMTQTPQTVTAPIHQLVTSVIPSTPERPSAGAPTLSMLLALPANLPKGTLPALPSSKTSNASETGASRSTSSKQTTQAPAIQVSNVEAGDIDTDNVGEIIERIDDVIGKDKIPDVIDKDEMNEIMEDIEELIKEEITKSPSTSESASVVIETFPVAQEKTEERLESKIIDEPIALTGSPESEMAIEEIDQSTPDIAEIIGTSIETSKPKNEAKVAKKEDDSEENKPEKMSNESKEKDEETVAVENKSKEEIKMIVDEDDKVDEDKESKSKEEMDEKFIENKEVEEKVEAPEEEKEDGEVEKEKINLDDKSEDKVCEEKSKEVEEELVEKEESEEKVEEVSEDAVEDKAETEEVKEESKDEEEVKEEEKIVKENEDDKGTEESKDEVLDTKEKKMEMEKIEECEDKEVLGEKEEKEEIKEEKVCLENEKVKKEEIDEKEEVKDVIEVKDSKEEIKEDDQKGGEEEEKGDMEEEKVKKEDKDKIEEVTPEKILPEKVEDVKPEVEDKISEEESKVENEESAKEEEGEENYDEVKEEPELKEEETEEKEEVEEKKEKVEKVEKEEDLESKEADDVEVKKEELISTPENTEVEEESSLIKLSGGRAMKTYSKKQNVAVDRESEIENSGEEGDYRNWKKAVLLVYQRFTQHKYASIFLRPITEDHAPGYHSVIFRPMDLSTIKKNIENGTIRSTMHFQRDIMLMFQNALMYNKRNTLIYKMAMSMQEDCLQEFQMLVGVTKDVSFRRETRTAGSSSSEVNESNILKRKRSHITPSPHDSESPRMKKRKSEND